MPSWWRPVYYSLSILIFMAKYSRKRTKKTKTSRRRRRVGALALNPSSQLVQLGSVAVGFLMATPINGAIDKVVPTNFDPKLVAAGQIGIGAALVLKKQKSMATTVIGGVMAGAGLKRAMGAFGIGRVGGYQNVPAIGTSAMNGYQNVPAIGARTMNGYRTNSANLAGYNTSRVPVSAYGSGSDLMQ